MTVMEEAFRAAGIVGKPLIEQTWMFIKAYPDCLMTDVAAGLKMSKAQAANTLYQLTKRKMVEYTEEMRRVNGHSNMSYVRPIRRYRIAKDMQQYELLPWPKASPKQRAAVESRPVKPVVESPVTAPAKVEASHPVDQFDLDSMPIGRARLLYEQLHRLFGK